MSTTTGHEQKKGANTGNEVPVATAVAVEPAAAPLQPTVVEGTFQDNERYGVCRKCRRVFERPPGVNDGQAQYYRCPDCDKDRITDIIIGSCIIS